MLYLNNGKWNARQVIPPTWITKSQDPQFSARAHDSEVPNDYGVNFWLGNLGNQPVAIAWGHCGQMVHIFQQLKMLVVITTNTQAFDCGSGSRIAVPKQKHMKEFEAVLLQFIIPAAK